MDVAQAVALIRDGREDADADVAAAIDGWTAAADWESAKKFAAAAAALGDLSPGRATKPILALARAFAFVDAAGSRALLAQIAANPAAVADVADTEALIAAVDDVPSGEGAARRALSRVAAERAWKPDAWGRDHGGLVALVRRYVKRGSERFEGPLIAYLLTWAPEEVRRIAKRPSSDATKMWEHGPRPPNDALIATMQSREYLGANHGYEAWVGESGRRDEERRIEAEAERDAGRDPRAGRSRATPIEPATRRARDATRFDRKHGLSGAQWVGLGFGVLILLIVVIQLLG